MRSFLNKTFVIERGSIRGSIIQLSALVMGPGVFTLPYVMSVVGFVLGIILHIAIALTTLSSMKFLL